MSRCLKLSTVAFALSAIFSVANAFEFDLTTETGTAGQYAGVANPVMDIDGDVVIHAKDVPSDIARAYGYWANSNSSRIINGNLDINIERVNNDPRVWSLRVENGASLSVNGDVLIRSSTVGAQLVGLAEYNNGLLNLSNSKTDISLESDTGRLIGIAVESDSTLILGETLVNINASDYAEGTLENPRWVQALYSAKGAIEALEDVTLNVTTYDNQLINAGATTIRVVNLEGSAYNTSAQFNKDLNINVDAQAQRIIGVYVSGDTSSSEDLHAGVDVAGTLGINIQAISDYVTGIYAQGESGVTASGVSINIQSEKEGAVVYGIQSVANPKYYPGPGSVNVNENTLLKLSGKGDLVGVLSMGAMNDRGSFVGLNGSSVVNVVSEDGTAVGIAVQEQAYAEIANLTANIETKSTSLDKEAIGIDLDNAELRISGANSIYAQGGNATAISLEDSVLTLAGSITAIGETLGIQSGENAEILLNDEASLVTNSIQSLGTISLSRGSSLEVTGSNDGNSVLGTVEAVNATLRFGAGSYDLSKLSGDGNTLVLTDLVNSQGVSIAEKTGGLNIVASGSSNDQYSNVFDTAGALLDAVDIANDENKDQNKLKVEAGAVNNSLVADIVLDDSGNQILTNVVEKKNDKLDAFSSVAALSALTLRHEMNSLSKRMGDLRDSPDGVGVWARAYGSEMEYGDQHVTAKNNSIQIGSDYTVGDWKVGLAFTYTDGESTYNKGSADNKGYGFAVYGTWFVPCGAYLDLMAKYNRLDNDFKLNGMDGSYENDAYGVSAETGYRFSFMNGGVYVEPQIGLSYSQIRGESIKTSNGVSIEQDDYDSLIGRVGLRTGFKFPEDKGTIYARVSGVYDFQGEVSGKAKTASSSNTIDADLGGAWIEMGVGANFNWTKNTYTYVDFERTNGGDVKENYRWNVGVRHTF